MVAKDQRPHGLGILGLREEPRPADCRDRLAEAAFLGPRERGALGICRQAVHILILGNGSWMYITLSFFSHIDSDAYLPTPWFGPDPTLQVKKQRHKVGEEPVYLKARNQCGGHGAEGKVRRQEEVRPWRMAV